MSTPAEATAQAAAGRAASSFSWAMRLMPAARRDAIHAVYDFCRAVDDIADGPLAPEAKRDGLDRWRAEVDRVFVGTPLHPIGRRLVPAVRDYGLAKADLLAVIDGVAQDAAGSMRAPPRAVLDGYIDGVACAPGRLAIRVFGCPPDAGLALAAALGRALQLTNILRDLDEDADAGRLYVPRELLEAHGIPIGDPRVVLGHPALPKACAELAGEARAAFAHANAALDRCPRRTVRAARLMGAVYRNLLARLESRGWVRVDQPVRVPMPVKLWLVFRHGLL